MAEPKKASVRMTTNKLKAEIERLNKLLENGARCGICGILKDKDDKFYFNTDPIMKAQFTPICRDCARKLALMVDEDGEEHEPTKESVQLALKYLGKPFLDKVWDASIQESENLMTGKMKNNVWTSYIKNIQMKNYVGMTYFDSDHLKSKSNNKVQKAKNPSVNKMLRDHEGQDTYDSYQKNKEDVIRLLDYDPFEKELISDQPFLYAQLLALLDSSEEANEDMIRTSSAISIARGFLQASKLDDTIAKLMADATNLERNSPTIKSLQDSKQKVMNMITSLAAESCLSLKNSKHSVKGENTWTGKIKKIKDLNLRNTQVNGFDIATCRGMQQVQEISDASIMKQLALDESEWSDMVAEMRSDIQQIRKERDQYREINRILLRENLDLKDWIEEQGLKTNIEFEKLKDIYSVFGGDEGDEIEDTPSE